MSSEAAPLEAVAPLEAAPLEAAPLEAAPLEAAPVDPVFGPLTLDEAKAQRRILKASRLHQQRHENKAAERARKAEAEKQRRLDMETRIRAEAAELRKEIEALKEERKPTEPPETHEALVKSNEESKQRVRDAKERFVEMEVARAHAEQRLVEAAKTQLMKTYMSQHGACAGAQTKLLQATNETDNVLHEVLVGKSKRDDEMHAHIKTSYRGGPAKKPQAPGCWKCLAGKSVTALTAIEVDVDRFLLRDLNRPHNSQSLDCRCFDCFRKKLGHTMQQAREMIFDLNTCVERIEERLQDAYADEEERAEELYELREEVARLRGEQLVREEPTAAAKPPSPSTAKSKARRKAKKKAAAEAAAAPPSPDRKLVPVFGDAPSVGGGAFEALVEEEEDVKPVLPLPPSLRVIGPPGPVVPPAALVPVALPQMQWAHVVGSTRWLVDANVLDGGANVLDNDGNPFMQKAE